MADDLNKKPTIDGLKIASGTNDFDIAYEEDDSFVVPEKSDVVQAKRKLKPLSSRPAPSNNKAGIIRIFRQRVRIKLDKLLVLISQGLKNITHNSRQKVSRRVASFRKYQTAVISVTLVYSLAFTLIRGADAKDNIESLSQEAQNNIVQTFDYIDKGDLASALKSVGHAQESITKLKILLQSWGQDVQYLGLVPENHSRLVAYEGLMDGAYTILNTFSSLKSGLTESLSKDAAVANSDIDILPSIDLGKFQVVMSETIDKIEDSLTLSKATLQRSRNNLPTNLQEQCDKAIVSVDKTLTAISSTKILIDQGLPWLSGSNNQSRNILILFQNNAELRASGGFLGSFALVKLKDGKISDLNFETNIYKLDTAYSQKMNLAPPPELAYSTVGWAMRDANFAIDFPESMAKVKEFFTAETGEKVDGVVALDTTLFLDLLKVVGPIDMPDYQKTITADNFLSDVQYEVEKGYFERSGGKEENEPKKILADMMPKFLNKLITAGKDEDKMPEILAMLGKGLSEKHLLFNVSDPELQSVLAKMGYAGQVDHELSDYLFIHNTNIQGKKSSLNVSETVKHHIEIYSGGKIDSSLEIIRQHNGSGVWPDGTNINLIRILLPEGSKVASFEPKAGNFWPNFDQKNAISGNFYTGEEAGKTKISFWQNTKPGESSDSILEYAPNYSVDTQGDNFTYHLTVQKEPGVLGDNYELELTYPAGFRPINVKNYDAINHKILIKDIIKTDKEFSLNFERIGNQ